jgi:hypothetical protein
VSKLKTLSMRKLSVGNALAELNRRRLADLQSRQQATTILGPEAMRGGKASPAKLLWTTLGGQARPITNEDLVRFRRSVKAVGSKLQGGITTQDLINLSAPADRERARREIPHAAVARLRNGEVVFSVRAGPESRVNRHVVTVAFPGYGAALSRPGTPLQAAMWLGKEAPLKIDCDCEHFRYRLRAIATIGGFNAGRPETGFPKLTNPTLIGVACKHVLRVMAELQGSMHVRRQIAQMIEADRARLDAPGKVKPRVILPTQADADRATQRAKPRAIFSTTEAEKRALTAGIRANLARRRTTTGPTSSLGATLAELQSRRDIPSAAILKALQAVLANHPERTSK